MTTTRRTLVGAALLLTLTACGTAPSPQVADAPRGDSGTTITTVVLRNGVTCAVMDGANSKALQCDWTGPRQAPSDQDPRGDRGTTVTLATGAGRACAVLDGKPGKALSCEGMS